MAERPIRGLRGSRCIHCRVRLAACVCDVLPSLPTSGPVSVVVHSGELRRSTNTGFLVTRALLGARLLPHDGPLPRERFEGALLLMPGAARELSPGDRGRPLVFLDGSWRQARRIFRKTDALRAATPVRLPEGAALEHRLREATVRGGLATLEAAARALGIVEGPAHERALLRVMEALVTRMRRLRGF